PLLTARGVSAGLRASIGLGTTTEHLDRLLRGLRDYLANGPRAEYEVVAGRWQPTDDQRALPEALALLQDLHAAAGAPSVLATAGAGGGCLPVAAPAADAGAGSAGQTQRRPAGRRIRLTDAGRRRSRERYVLHAADT